MASLESINRQVSSIGSQLESIGLSCQTEKKVLEESITARNMLILCLLFIGAMLGFLLVKRR